MDSVRLLAVTTTSARPRWPRAAVSDVLPAAAWPDRHPASESTTTAHSSDLQLMLPPIFSRICQDDGSASLCSRPRPALREIATGVSTCQATYMTRCEIFN